MSDDIKARLAVAKPALDYAKAVNKSVLIPPELFQQMRTALLFANKALSENRFAGTDQNPYGVTDLVGSAHLAVERFVDKGSA